MSRCPPGYRWSASAQQCERSNKPEDREPSGPPQGMTVGELAEELGLRPGAVIGAEGQDYGGRTVGFEGTLGMEGRDVSNYIDPTLFLTAQAGRYNPETREFEGGYAGDYGALFAREDPIAQALGIELLQRGEATAGRTGTLSDLIAQQAAGVAQYGPAAAASGAQTAEEMQRYADMVSMYGPAAVRAAGLGAQGIRGQAGDVRAFTDPASLALSDYGGNQLALYGSQFRPIEQQIAEYARTYDTPQRRAEEARRAQADVARSYEQQRRAAARDLARYGVDPSMGRGQAIRERTAQATSQAAAAEAARRAVEDRAAALRAQAAALGGQVAGRGAATYGQGAQLGAGGAQTAAELQQLAAALEQQGITTGANVGATGANIQQGAGAARLSGLQTGANVGQQSGQLLTGASNIAQQGALTGSNIQLAGQGARFGAVPMLTQAQGANLQGGNIMQNWNQLIGATQGNRMEAPSGLSMALGQAVGSFAGSYAGGRSGGIQGGGTTSASTGAAGGGMAAGDAAAGAGAADGGYIYSTRQRFYDGGVVPSGTPVSAWVQNSPARPITGRSYEDGGEVRYDRRCQRIGNRLVMPDGSPCGIRKRTALAEFEASADMADGGAANDPNRPGGTTAERNQTMVVRRPGTGTTGNPTWPIIGSIAGRLIGTYYGGSVGGAIGQQIGGRIGSTIAEAKGEGPRPATDDPRAYSAGPQQLSATETAQQQSPGVQPSAVQQASAGQPTQQFATGVQPIEQQPDQAAEGGRVYGPSDGTGIDDQVPAQLSAGEYVIPADVVAKLGTNHFDKLLDRYHVPAEEQREQMRATA